MLFSDGVPTPGQAVDRPEGRRTSEEATLEQVRLPGSAAQNAVTGIAQDQQGFLWLATEGGLVRYDGYEFTTYTYNPLDSTSLSYNRVECLYVDRAGRLWVGTFGGGLSRFDPRTQTFTRYQHDEDDPASLSDDVVTVILEDPEDPKSLSNDQVQSLSEDRQGVLWVGTGSPFESKPEAGGSIVSTLRRRPSRGICTTRVTSRA